MADVDTPFASVQAIGQLKKGKGKVKVVLVSKNQHALTELEIDVKGVKKSEPVKDAKGVAASKQGSFTVAIEVDPKTPAGETVLEVEIKIVDVDSKGEKTPRTIQLSVPVAAK